MRQETIDRIRERIALARERHGKFLNSEHVIKTILLELSEADYATNWQGPDRFIDELLDVATVAIRGVEQLSGAEVLAESAKPTMPDNLWIPAMGVSEKASGTLFSIDGRNGFDLRQVNYNSGDISWFMDTDDARAIRDWLNQFIAASEAEQ